MTRPAAFDQHYLPIANAIARLDVDQVTREKVATAVRNGIHEVRLNGDPRIGQRKSSGWEPDLFWLLAADPLVLCAGSKAGPCPHAREIRVAMHLSTADDGRAVSWSLERPVVRCVSCGSIEFGSERTL